MNSKGSVDFYQNVDRAMADPILKKALGRLKDGFQAKRNRAAEHLPEFDQLRDLARDIKDHSLAHLDFYLEMLEEQVQENGGKVHWAMDANEACQIVARICREADAQKIIKSKSMVTEEIGLNKFLEKEGFSIVETDLGEYIIQLRQEHPSHIIAASDSCFKGAGGPRF